MRAVVTRVKSAYVDVENRRVGEIGPGFLVLLGVGPEDTEENARRLADKVCGVRVFEDENGKMNLNIQSAGGEILAVSQFTLYADLKSRRPGFSHAAQPSVAEPLYEKFAEECRSRGLTVKTGVFGAHREVGSVNDGPVTLIFDTDNL